MAKDSPEPLPWNGKLSDILSLIQMDIIYVVDTNWRARYVNDFAAKMMGKKKSEIIGKNIDELFSKDEFKRMKENLKKVMDSGEALYVTAPVLFKGQDVWLHNSLSAMKDEKGEVVAVLGVGRDITEQKKIEHELAASEEKYRAITEKSSDGIIIITEDNNVKFANQKMAELVGLSVKEMIGKQFIDYIDKKFISLVSERRMKRFRGEDVPSRYEIEIIKKGDGSIPVEINSSIVEYNSTRATLSVVRDIGERRRLEEDVKESEALFRAVFEQSAVGISVISSEGQWLRVNKALADITGYSIKELLDKNFSDITYPEDIEPSNAVRKKLLSGEISRASLEKRYIHKDKNVVWVDLNISLIRDNKNNPQYFLALTHNITDRKKAEEDLKRSEKKFRDLADLLPANVFEINLEGKNTFVNKYGFESLGYEQADLKKGIDTLMTVIPEDRDMVAGEMKKVLDGKNVIIESHLLRKNGSTYPTIIYGSPIMEDGKIIGVRGVSFDISEQKKAEEDLKSRAVELEQLNKVMVGRELKMIELKDMIEALKKENLLLRKNKNL